jgi:hypothetical protein
VGADPASTANCHKAGSPTLVTADLWSGRPPRNLLLWTQDVVLIPSNLLWCGIVVSFETTAMRS